MRLNEMYPNLQTDFAKDIDLKPFCPNFNDLYIFKYRSTITYTTEIL